MASDGNERSRAPSGNPDCSASTAKTGPVEEVAAKADGLRTASPCPSLRTGETFAHSPGSRVGSFDTDAFGVLLRMKVEVYQTFTPSFMLSSQS